MRQVGLKRFCLQFVCFFSNIWFDVKKLQEKIAFTIWDNTFCHHGSKSWGKAWMQHWSRLLNEKVRSAVCTFSLVRIIERKGSGFSRVVSGLVTNSILFCWLFKIEDRCKIVRFQQTHYLCSSGSNARGELRALEGRRVSSKKPFDGPRRRRGSWWEERKRNPDEGSLVCPPGSRQIDDFSRKGKKEEKLS